MHCIAEACILRAHPTQRYYLSRQAHPTRTSYCCQITYEVHPACGYGPYVPYGQLIQDCVSLSWVSPSNGNVDTRTGRAAGTPPHAETPYGISRDISPCTCMLGERICARFRMRLQSFGSRRAFAHVYLSLQNPLLSSLAFTLRSSYWAISHCAATDSAIPLHYVEGIQSGTIQAHARRIQHPVLNL